jgi:hypothetical protein
VGTKIEVTTELVGGGGARLFIQHGEIRRRRDVAVHEPYCLFVSNRPRSAFSEPLVVAAGVFTVTSSFRRLDYTSAEGTELADLDSNRDLSTIMQLSSDTQPEIDRLTCSRWGSRILDRFLTIADMRGALGGLVNINLPVE